MWRTLNACPTVEEGKLAADVLADGALLAGGNRPKPGTRDKKWRRLSIPISLEYLLTPRVEHEFLIGVVQLKNSKFETPHRFSSNGKISDFTYPESRECNGIAPGAARASRATGPPQKT
jgi:hypothetical protein